MDWGFVFAGVMLAALLMPAVAVAEVDGWTNSRCLNSTHLFLWDDMKLSGRDLLANTTVDCTPFECNNLSETCNQPYQMTAVQADFSLYFFFFMFIAGIVALFFGIAKKKKHVVLTIFATIMFLIMGLQSVALDAVFIGTFFAGFTSIFIGLCWILAIVSFLATLIGMVSYATGKSKRGHMNQVRYG